MLPTTIELLRSAVRRNERFDYLFFFGHTGRPDGRLAPACFSQWWGAPFELEGHTYPTAEHWMMASKARLFGDAEALTEILRSPSPAKAKQLGRTVRGFDEGRWKAARFDLVTRGNEAKFSSTPELRDYLLGTGRRILVEASPRDRIWGIGLAASSPAAQDPLRWRGSNLLGFALVCARELIRRTA